MPDAKILDRDEFGTLYTCYVPFVDQSVSFYVTEDDHTYTAIDMQGIQPMSIDEMQDFQMVDVNDFAVIE